MRSQYIDGRLFFEEKQWYLDAEPQITTLFQRLFPATKIETEYGSSNKFKFTHRARVIQDTYQVRKDINWFIKRFNLEISQKDKDLLIFGEQQFDEKQKKLKDAFYKKPRIKLNLALPLREYQKKAVSLALARKNLLIADQVGLGKTPTAIGIAARKLPCLCVVPPHLVTQWEEEIKKFFPHARVHKIMTGKTYTLPKADFYINAYSRIAKWEWIFCKDSKVKTLILDEVHNVRNGGSLKFDAVHSISETCEYKVGLSATPVMNYGRDVFNIFSILDPQALGKFDSFNREWCSFGSIRDPQLLGDYLRKNMMMVRRTRKDVQIELDPVQRTVYDVDADLETLRNFDAEAQALAMKVVTGDFREAGEASRELDWKMRQITGVSKAKAVAEVVKVILNSGEKVVIFGWHRDVYDIWLKELVRYNPVMYTGSETPKHKEAAKKEFIEGQSQVFIMSLRSGAGLNGLQEVCSYAVFGELDWSPGIIEQCIGRLWRDGQENQVNAIFVTINDGADPYMKEVIGLKSTEAHKILSEEKNPSNTFAATGENKITNFAKEYLKSKGVDVEQKIQEKKEGIIIEPPKLGSAYYDIYMTLKGMRLYITEEKEMQHQIGKNLEQSGYSFEREVRISEKSIPDFVLSGDIIIECKTKNFSKPELLKQIKRYIRDYSNVKAVFVMTPSFIHNFQLDSVPVYAINVANNSLLMGELS